MNWYIVFYLFSLADKISEIFGWFFFISIIVFGVSVVALWAVHNDFKGTDKYELLITTWKKLFWRFGLVAFMSGCVYAFTPDRDDMTLIVAGGAVGQFIMNDDNAKELPADITRFLRGEIVGATKDLSADIKQTIKKEFNIKTRKDSLMEIPKEKLIDLLDK